MYTVNVSSLFQYEFTKKALKTVFGQRCNFIDKKKRFLKNLTVRNCSKTLLKNILRNSKKVKNITFRRSRTSLSGQKKIADTQERIKGAEEASPKHALFHKLFVSSYF